MWIILQGIYTLAYLLTTSLAEQLQQYGANVEQSTLLRVVTDFIG